jgi:septal ring factor EnvC (AmiA/AmiB activator)
MSEVKVAGDPLVATLKRRYKTLTKRINNDNMKLEKITRDLATLEMELEKITRDLATLEKEKEKV